VVDFLVAVGLVFVVLAFWKGRNQAARERKELEEYKRVKDELVETKKEVGSLLEQLETVSVKVVEEITSTVDEVRRSGKEVVPSDLDAKDVETPGNKPILSNDNLGDYDSKNAPEESELDEGIPELMVELTGRHTEKKTYHREKTEAKSRLNTKPGSNGKTILFPRKMETGKEKPVEVNYSESESEVSPKHQMVYAMERLGYPEDEIARQMNIGKGEVSLILQIKRKGEELNA